MLLNLLAQKNTALWETTARDGQLHHTRTEDPVDLGCTGAAAQLGTVHTQ